MENSKNEPGNFWRNVTALCLTLLIAGCAAKIALSTMTVTIDFATLLSVLLALFSVALSVLFYFKATETSNAFYDNTYKYTKDIAELLVRIEASFGEKLTHLDAGYRSLVEGQKSTNTTPDIRSKLEQEKAELEKVVEDRTQIIEKLIENSHLEAEEKARISDSLKAKDQELEDLSRHVNRLRSQLKTTRRWYAGAKEINEEGVTRYTRNKIVKVLGPELILKAGTRELMREFDKIMDSLHEEYLRDLEVLGHFEEGALTFQGAQFLRRIAKSEDHS